MSCLATELNAANTVIAAYTYDNNDNVKTQTQKFDGVTTNDAITSFDDDPLNRLTKITDALAGVTQYGYDDPAPPVPPAISRRAHDAHEFNLTNDHDHHFRTHQATHRATFRHPQ